MILILLLPVMALLSMFAFRCANWTTINYEGQQIPYSLGVFVVFSYAVLCAFPPTQSLVFSYGALAYVIGIWLIGFLDDRFGQAYPKGLKGHFSCLVAEKKVTTGVMKVIGTLLIAMLFTYYYQPQSVWEGIRCFLLLTWLPHVMNLFDTRPLRVWKVVLFFTVILLLTVALPSLTMMIYLLVVFYLTFVLEGHRRAMLGDNGATAVGAILALLTVSHTSIIFQSAVIILSFSLMVIAERMSFSALIEQRSVLRWVDKIGIPSRR
ncbi:hypothetical protein [Halalkalibacter urbisdiaboli]|uniref:hypothetical protein n=1 Tax=Halalkalibacter urbisdiaboli TaxID=1960589 RepID=UPI000B44AF50|nr:hypothetical protein [Halalkalibacter urbisdiaboli]